ncbi:pyridoxal phosphate-dependent decarboxylase family protein [Halioglobus pacificus]|uniref:Cytochrome d ubiquinol oxidase subunit I n=1 Tax=Parahalioglobus pacificus TaxID=930806 RepID=A0A918XHH3_9GAMM|nr:pyridoxal-dependent decarboxylase [Halioglobus pacificus]GHD32265.1 cytochrome d ubiquinol oxidase subunit I [Halioglobus pacificus]
MTTTSTLDPENWDDFRAQAHAMLDAALDHIAGARDKPWRPVPSDLGQRYAIPEDADSGLPPEQLVEKIRRHVLPHHGGNTHPRFWGWVQGTGLASDVMAAIASTAINGNLGGRHHGANEMEREVIDWTRRVMGMPEGSSGVFVTGTSQATVLAFQAARVKAIKGLRTRGQAGVRLTAYAAAGVHNATKKALEALGIGSDNLRLVPLMDGKPDPTALRDMLAKDRADGALPFLLIGTAGSVDVGAFDDLNTLADLAEAEQLWLHVDGAFGAWTRLADEPWRSLSDGIGRADSLALDFHKWMYVGYDCGLVLMRDEEAHRAAFAARPDYLQGADTGLAGGEPWFCDYGIDLSRGNRAIKVWCALQMYGQAAFAEAITDNCQRAAQLGELVQAEPAMALGAPVISNVCVFTARSDLDSNAQSTLNAHIAQTLQDSGTAVFSTTKIGGTTLLRAAITNHRTTADDVTAAIAAVAREATASI